MCVSIIYAEMEVKTSTSKPRKAKRPDVAIYTPGARRRSAGTPQVPDGAEGNEIQTLQTPKTSDSNAALAGNAASSSETARRKKKPEKAKYTPTRRTRSPISGEQSPKEPCAEGSGKRLGAKC